MNLRLDLRKTLLTQTHNIVIYLFHLLEEIDNSDCGFVKYKPKKEALKRELLFFYTNLVKIELSVPYTIYFSSIPAGTITT